MRKIVTLLMAGALASCGGTGGGTITPSPGSTPSPAPTPTPTVAGAPDLVIAISVDQFSTEIFEEYAPRFVGGLGRMTTGIAFPTGYQAHGNTETCPGHSTIMTGMHPANTGIVANNWVDFDASRENKRIYCAEDENRTPASGYLVSPEHLLVDTLGDRLKSASPSSRVVAVSGKDRAGVMMGGHRPDQRWYWSRGEGFVTDLGVAPSPVVNAINASTLALIDRGIPALTPSAYCEAKSKSYSIGDAVVGNNRLEVAPGKAGQFEGNPAYDGAVLALAAGLIDELSLGRGDAPDILTLGLSATDYVGHRYGNGGQEMCLQLTGLDDSLGDFFDHLDGIGLDYLVVLTGDHGAMDIPPRLRDKGVSTAAYLDPALATSAVAATVGAEFGLSGDFLGGGEQGDIFIDPAALAAHGTALTDRLVAFYEAHPQVDTVFTSAQIEAQPVPTGNPTRWTKLERARASYHPARSGDLYVIFKEYVMAIPDPMTGYVAGHGSVHTYDRQVPVLFWRSGMAPQMSDRPAKTVDIMPTLANAIDHSELAAGVDGTCLVEVGC